MKSDEDIFKIIRTICSIDHVKPDDIPNIDLYMDQVTTFMDSHMADSKRSEDDKILTKTMINNYTKNNLLPPPIKKKYSRDHLYLLIYIYYLKNLLSINDIHKVLGPMTDLFYHKDSDINLDDIYEGIYKQESKHSAFVIQDILKRFKDSKSAFPDVKDPEQADFLSKFALICMLSYDVYIRKSMIERMIDDTFLDQIDPSATVKKPTDK